MSARRRVLIVGAGPAGLAAADALSADDTLRRTYEVTLLEASAHLGGKCGAVDSVGGPPIEHGPHVFPGWYRNTRAVLETVGAGDRLVDVDGLWLVRPDAGAHPSAVRCFEPPTSPRAAARLFGRGPLPPSEMARYLALLAQLVVEADRELAVDPGWDAPRAARVRGRTTAAQATLDDAVVLGALAVAGEAASARTIARTTSFFLRTPRPYLSVLDGPMHELWIAPWAARLSHAGVHVEHGTPVSGVVPGPAVRVAGDPTARRADAVILATPAEVTRRLVSLPGAERLAVGAMGALDVWLDGAPALPPGPALLEGSRFALTFMNLTRLWRRTDLDGHRGPGTRLSFIVPAGAGEVGGDPEALLEDITRWLGGPGVRVAGHRWRPNTSAPLFLNTSGSWQARPDAGGTGLERVWLAGDWVRHPIEVATMEGAIWSGRDAARRLDLELGTGRVPPPLMPRLVPRALLSAASAVARSLRGLGRTP